MRVPLSWLSELTPLAARPSERSSVVELASELDALGLVVARTEWVGEGFEEVVLARVLEIAPIEGADRIRRVVVDRGGGETAEVVCGAWNFAEGDVVPLAPVGSELPGGVRIERRKMRGVTSNGMLCSGRELGLSDDQAGILVLERPEEGAAQRGELGLSLADYLGFGKDVVFDLEIEANRPDCLSLLGIARELAAHYGLPLHQPEPSLDEAEPPASELAAVEIDSPELCFRLIGRVLTGLRPVSSPLALQRRLLLCGMRPINHVVDASNYVMLELGQPTHPYDLDQLGGNGLRVRAAHPGETIVTLDGDTRILGGRPPRRDDPLSGTDALICSLNDLPVGIAGVMGGQSSEIGEETERVLLEVAHFAPLAVGRTARHLSLRTEASVRFERGIDPAGLERAAARFCELVVEAARAAGIDPPKVARGIVDATTVPFRPTSLVLRPARANSLLGLSLEAEEMARLLAPIGYETAGERSDERLELVVPSFRPDVEREVDVIEDVARTYGYRRIPPRQRRSPLVGRLDATQEMRRRIRRILAGVGAHEAWTSSIVDPSEHELAGIGADLVRLANPMVAEESSLRAGLLPGLLHSLRHNAGHRNYSLRLFEIGDVFVRRPVPAGPDERERIAVILAREGDDARAAMSVWRVVSDALGLASVEVRQAWLAPLSEVSADGEVVADARRDVAAALAGLHRTRSGLLVIAPVAATGDAVADGPVEEGSVLGAVGEVDPAVIAAFGLPHERVGWLELDLARLVEAPRRPELAQPVSRYPSSDVDLAFSVPEEIAASAIEAILRLSLGPIGEEVELFDVYRGPGLPEGERSLAYRLRLCADDHTMTDEEVGEIRTRCIDAVEAATPARLRG